MKIPKRKYSQSTGEMMIRKYIKEKYVENRASNIAYKKQSIRKVLKCNCYIKYEDTKKIQKVE